MRPAAAENSVYCRAEQRQQRNHPKIVEDEHSLCLTTASEDSRAPHSKFSGCAGSESQLPGPQRLPQPLLQSQKIRKLALATDRVNDQMRRTRDSRRSASARWT